MKFKPYHIFFFIILTSQNLFSQVTDYEKFLSYFSDAQNVLLEDNIDSALVLLNQANDVNPHSAAVNYLLSKVYEKTDDIFFAILYANTAIELAPENIWYKRHLFELYSKNGFEKDANSLLFDILKYQNISDYQQAIEYFYETNQEQNLKNTMLEYFDKFGIDRDYLSLLIDVLTSLGDTISAYNYAYKFLSLSPENIDAYEQLINLFEMQQKYDSVFLYIEKYNKYLPSSFDINILKTEIYGELFLQTSDTIYVDSSFVSFKQALATDNINSNRLMSFLTGKKNVFSIVTLNENYNDFLSVIYSYDSTNSQILNYLYSSAYANNFYFDAIYYLENSLSKDFSSMNTYVSLCNLYIRFKQWHKLDSLTDVALSLFPLQPYFYLFKSVALLNSDDFQSALKFLQTGKSYVFDDNNLLSYFYFFTAQFYALSGNQDEYKNFIDQSIDYAQGNCDLLSFFAFYSARSGDLEQAMKYISFCLIENTDELKPRFLYIYAYILFKKEDYSQALQYIETAISTADKPNFLYFMLKAQIYEKLGKYQQADYFKKLSKKFGNKCEYYD